MAEPQHIERREERLVPRVERERRGTVHISKNVEERPQTLDIDVEHDELYLARRAVERPLGPDEQLVQQRNGETVVLVTEERVEVRKVPWVVEELRIGRDVVTEQEHVRSTVRREAFDIETDGDVDLKQQHDH